MTIRCLHAATYDNGCLPTCSYDTLGCLHVRSYDDGIIVIYRCPELVSKLCSITGQSRLHFSPAESYFLPVEGDIDKMYNNKVS